MTNIELPQARAIEACELFLAGIKADFGMTDGMVSLSSAIAVLQAAFESVEMESDEAADSVCGAVAAATRLLQ